MDGILANVRQSCCDTAQRAKYVRIDNEALSQYAAKLDAVCVPIPSPERSRFSSLRLQVNWICVLAQLNFGSGYRQELAAHCGTGAFQTMHRGTTKLLENGWAYDAAALAAADAALIKSHFGMDGVKLQPLVDRMVRSLRTTGTVLQTLGFADWFHFLEHELAHDATCNHLVSVLVANFPTFQDAASHGTQPVYFYKKAQVVAADLFRSLGSNPATPQFHFPDLATLTIMADNVIPAVLGKEGVIVLSPELQRKIDLGQPLPSGSPEEVELRACAVAVGERLTQLANHRFCAADLDHALWLKGKAPGFRSVARHATQDTEFY